MMRVFFRNQTDSPVAIQQLQISGRDFPLFQADEVAPVDLP